jgi:hypothetical protein
MYIHLEKLFLTIKQVQATYKFTVDLLVYNWAIGTLVNISSISKLKCDD